MIEIQHKIKSLIAEALNELGIEAPTIHLEHPDILAHGDYASNVALIVSKSTGKSPQEIASSIASWIDNHLIPEIIDVEVAGPGFLNFHLSRDFFASSIERVITEDNFGTKVADVKKRVLYEYTDPNPFKPFHIGHLMSNAIGETLSRLEANIGNEVIRANYQGDVGLHVAKAIYGILNSGDNWKSKMDGDVSSVALWIGQCYAEGARLYEEDEDAKNKINQINKSVYARDNDEINSIYDIGRKRTLEAFEIIYKKLGTKFDYYFFESEMAEKGLAIVKANTPNVFSESEGAIVFDASKHDSTLHTRVFITSQGLPAYEAKEIGLVMTKFQSINPDQSITVTASEQKDYMRVVTSAIREIDPEIAERMHHVTHGMLRFASGKMSSRKGNVITGESLISSVEEMVLEKIKDRDLEEVEKKQIAEKVAIGAIKYSILRQSPGKDIIFDKDKALSFEGDSGPYLQYAYVRTLSLLEKARAKGVSSSIFGSPEEVTDLERMIYRFEEVTMRASLEKAPQLLVEFLTSLSGAFNKFYAEGIIVSDEPDSVYKVALTEAFSRVMEKGLQLLAIPVVSRM